MDRNFIKSDDTEIEMWDFHQNNIPISINNINFNKIVVCKKLPFGKQDFKYFIGHKDSGKIRSSCIFRSHIVIYKIKFEENRCIYFLAKFENLFINYMEVKKLAL